MKLKKALVGWSVVTVVLAMVALGIPALAQDDDDTFMLEEIIVTAEKRTSDLQKLPLSVSAVGGEEMVRQNVLQIADLEKLMPEMQVELGANSFTVITIRGVEAKEYSPFAEVPTTVHLNGASLSRLNALDNHFFDIERIEVLKGPQGTLYGRGASAGTINIITRKPVLGMFGGNAELEFGNYDLMRAEGAVNVPITDELSMRAAFRSIKRDGYYEDTNTLNADNDAMRFSLLWEPTDRLSVLATADFETYLYRPSLFNRRQYLGPFGPLVSLEPPDEPYTNAQWRSDVINESYNESDSSGIMAQLDYDFDFATLTVQASTRDQETDSNLLLDAFNLLPIVYNPDGSAAVGTVLPINALLPNNNSAEWTSGEVRLTSNTQPGDQLEWVAGMYFFTEEVAEFISGDFLNYNFDPMETDSQAIFGQATWTPPKFDRLHITAGLRYDQYQKEAAVDNTLPIGAPDKFADADFDDTTYKFNLSYDLSDSNMIYGQIATGFKSGYISTDLEVAPSEEIEALEFGSKNRFFDNRLQVNFEAYYYDYKNYQEFAQPRFCYVDANNDRICEDYTGDGTVDIDDSYAISSTVSPGGAEQMGGSVYAQWLITRNDRLSGNLSYQYNEYGDYNLGASILAQFPDAIGIDMNDDLTGREFGPPNWRGNLSYAHTFHIRGTDLLEVTGDLHYTGEALDQVMRRNTPEEYTLPSADAYWLGDITVRYSSSFGMPAGMSWHVRLWCNNVWDSEDLAGRGYSDQNMFTQQYYGARSGYMQGQYVQPRTFGIVFGANW